MVYLRWDVVLVLRRRSVNVEGGGESRGARGEEKSPRVRRKGKDEEVRAAGYEVRGRRAPGGESPSGSRLGRGKPGRHVGGGGRGPGRRAPCRGRAPGSTRGARGASRGRRGTETTRSRREPRGEPRSPRRERVYTTPGRARGQEPRLRGLVRRGGRGSAARGTACGGRRASGPAGEGRDATRGGLISRGPRVRRGRRSREGGRRRRRRRPCHSGRPWRPQLRRGRPGVGPLDPAAERSVLSCRAPPPHREPLLPSPTTGPLCLGWQRWRKRPAGKGPSPVVLSRRDGG